MVVGLLVSHGWLTVSHVTMRRLIAVKWSPDAYPKRPTTARKATYMRITGPTIVIEYAPQGDRPGQAVADVPNHAHGTCRDPTNDNGATFAK